MPLHFLVFAARFDHLHDLIEPLRMGTGLFQVVFETLA